MSVFRVGQRVVCIREGKNREQHIQYYKANGFSVKLPDVGNVYTIREVFTGITGNSVIRLVELRNPVVPYADGETEVYFTAAHFRPVVERKTDISVFRAMLNTTPETVGA